VAILVVASADASTVLRVFNWMSGNGLRASDTMWPSTKFAHLLNLNSSFEDGRNEKHGEQCRSRFYTIHSDPSVSSTNRTRRYTGEPVERGLFRAAPARRPKLAPQVPQERSRYQRISGIYTARLRQINRERWVRMEITRIRMISTPYAAWLLRKLRGLQSNEAKPKTGLSLIAVPQQNPALGRLRRFTAGDSRYGCCSTPFEAANSRSLSSRRIGTARHTYPRFRFRSNRTRRSRLHP